MKNIDLNKLANIVTIRNHVFALLNGPTGVSLTNYDKTQSRALKAIITKLDKNFVDDIMKVLETEEPEVPRVAEVKPEAVKPKEPAKTEVRSLKKASKKVNKKISTDSDITKRLKEAKAELAAKTNG